VPPYLAAAVLLSVNWFVYVWSVNAGFIVETSLGYFINPLVSVLLGVVFLRERLRRWQWVAVALATAGVLYLAWSYGAPPWIALTLAFTFGTYGLVKKVAPLGSLNGLTLETGMLALPAVLYLIYEDIMGRGAFLRGGPLSDGLMAGAGLVTMVPLLMFVSAARRIPLSLLGILQYMAPTLQLLIGVMVYGEAFTRTKAVGFGVVWASLVIFGIDGLIAARRRHGARP
jgi:chloramphenicol-sensitive protein RarD